MGQSRKAFAVQWKYKYAPSQSVLTCDRGWIDSVCSPTIQGIRYRAHRHDGTLIGVFTKRKLAMEAVEGRTQ